MRAAFAPAVLLAGLLGACVTEEVPASNHTWEVTGDKPLLALPDSAPLLVAVPPHASQPPSGAQAQPAAAANPQNAGAPGSAAPAAPSVPPGAAQGAGTSAPGQGAAQGGASGALQSDAQQAPGGAPGQPGSQNKDELLKLIKPATEEGLEPDFLSETPPSPFHRLGHNVIRGMDGSWSKLYSIKSEVSDDIVHMLQTTVPNFPAAENTPSPANGKPTEIVKYVLHKKFYLDTTFPNPAVKLGVLEAIPNPVIADMLIVTAPPETLLFIDQVLDKLLADLPQIELQVRVVEVNLDDLLEWDTKVGINKLVDPNLPFNPTTNPVAGNFGAGFPILDGGGAGTPTGYGTTFSSFTTPTTLSGFLLSLQGVHNGVNVDALLSLLQTIGSSELISSPTVTVLNGHRALINTGDKVPVFSATGVGTSAQITTTYQDTGVKVEMIPFIVNEDVIRIDLSVDVSAVTSVVPFNLAGTEVETPVISTRNTGTTVHVHSGQVFAVGGLRNRDTIESITKVPILGDIPILGWLFKSRSSHVKNTEILFFITPTIRIPSETLVAPIGS